MAGITGDIIQDLIQWIMKKAGLLGYSLDDFAGSMLIRVHDPALMNSLCFKFIGFLVSVSVAIILGIAFVYLIELTGYKIVELKGALFGLITWLIIYGGIKTALHASFIQDYSPRDILLHLLIHLLFGFILGFFILKLRHFAAN